MAATTSRNPEQVLPGGPVTIARIAELAGSSPDRLEGGQRARTGRSLHRVSALQLRLAVRASTALLRHNPRCPQSADWRGSPTAWHGLARCPDPGVLQARAGLAQRGR